MQYLINIVLILATVTFMAGCSPGTEPTTNSAPPAAKADATSKDFGDYVVHFNALTTDQLTPEVAKQYGIVRSKNRAMLNVSIIRKIEGTTGQSVPGKVTATARNLTGQLKNLSLREVQSGGAVYYIGDVPVANGETLFFTVEVTPANESKTLSLQFSQQFYGD